MSQKSLRKLIRSNFLLITVPEVFAKVNPSQFPSQYRIFLFWCESQKHDAYQFLFSLFLVLPYLVLFLAPEVVLKATASVKNKTSILVSWQIERIHLRLQTPDTYQVSYCPHCRRKTCLEKNISTSDDDLTTLVGDLLVGVAYNITVRAINVAALDGTRVETPYGSYSEPVYNTTHEGGGWSLSCLMQARIEGQREETPCLALGICELHQSYF